MEESQRETVVDDISVDPGAAHLLGGPRLEPGEHIGRYLIVEKIGAGGMGIVCSAFDPRLDRKVALKVLRARPSELEESSQGQARILREAQALARLSHPAVVPVHDVDTHEGRVFMAMEYLPGGTLTKWLETPRDWRAITAMFVAAGRGLAAAHAAGMVHRDFKPENVLLTADGRPQVVDFGLVRASDAERFQSTASGLQLSDSVEQSGSLSTNLTRAGAIMGTPAFMSPEQFLGQDADARSDQFSFCLALWEALYKQHPHGMRDSLMDLATAVTDGVLVQPKRQAGVPGYVHRAVSKGLSRQRADRFEDMDSLLRALNPAHAGRRRAIGLGAGAVAVAGLGFWFMSPGAQEVAGPCDAVEVELQGTWDPAAKGELGAEFEAMDTEFAKLQWSVVEQRLDTWAAQWVEGARDNCRATLVARTQSDAGGDLRRSCLARQRNVVAARLSQFESLDDAVIDRADELVGELPSVSDCEDLARLTAVAPLPTEANAKQAAESADDAIAEGFAAMIAARPEQAREAAVRGVSLARESGHAPTLAESLRLSARLDSDEGRAKQAREKLEEAGFSAYAGGDDAGAAAAWTLLVDVVGDDLGDDTGWQTWRDAAESALARLGTEFGGQLARQTDARTSLFNAVGNVHEGQGRYEQALAEYERGFGLIDDAHPQAPIFRNNLAITLTSLGRYDEAEAHLRKALELDRQARPAGHPSIGMAMSNLANTVGALGRYDEAAQLHTEALAIHESVFGRTHPLVASSYEGLGNLESSRGNAAKAIEHLEQALEIKHACEVEDSDLGHAETNLADALMGAERFEDAEPHALAALRLLESSLGQEHPSVGIALHNVGKVHRHFGRRAEAREAFERALASHEKVVGPEHPFLAYHLTQLGELALDAGERANAVPKLERALTIREASEPDPGLLAETRYALARALASKDPTRAKSLVEDARRVLADSGEHTERIAEIDRWLASRD